MVQLNEDPLWQSVFVIGSTGSGKTTLCRYLGQELAGRYRTATVDCDPGQSALGPPTTVGLAWEPWDGHRPLALRFVGATTPVRHFLQTLTGVKRLAERASEENAEKVVFDSSGYIDTGAGREFHFQMVDLLQPDHLVVLQENDDMEPLLANFARRKKPQVHRLSPSKAVAGRSATMRRSYREGRFRRYFETAMPQTLLLNDIGFHGMIPELDNPNSYRNRLISLCDQRGFIAVLGVTDKIDLAGSRLQLYAPPFIPEQIASVQFGSISLDRFGREL